MAASSIRRSAAAKRKPSWGRLVRNGLVIFFSLGAVALFAGTVYSMMEIQGAAKLIPTLPDKMTSLSSEPTIIVSADGKQLLRFSGENRQPVEFKDIPKNVINSTLAAEDKRFYDHSGVDLMAVGRIGWEALFRDRTTGGSTLAMQLAKRFYTSPERTIQRKVKDMALAVQMERLLTKDQILELYLNQVYYGDGAYGVAAAARAYFNKPLDKVSLAEAALLARLVRRPSDENPRTNLEAAVRNRNIVLKVMLDEGMISKPDYDAAVQEPVKLGPDSVGGRVSEKQFPYFVDYVLKELSRVLPGVDVKKGGYRIETTIDSRIQREAEREINRTNQAYGSIRTGAGVVISNAGRVLAMVGGPDYKANQFNSAAQGRRQPGSSFKPFVYLVAARQGVVSSPWSSVDNTTVTYRDGRRTRTIKGGGSNGWVSMDSALAFSYNRAAWNTINRVGAHQVVRSAHNDLGFMADLPAVPSLSLGTGDVSPLEMAQAYTVFPLRGRRATAFGVERVIGPNGLPIFTAEPEFIQTTFSPKQAEIVDRCLRSVVTKGTGRAAGGVRNARGKTGTTNDNRDAWFAGYTENYTAVVWFANPVRSGNSVRYLPMSSSVMGGFVGAPTWNRIMRHTQAVLGESGEMTWTRGDAEANDGESTRERRRSRNQDEVLGDLAPTDEEPSAASRERERERTPDRPNPTENQAPEPTTTTTTTTTPDRQSGENDQASADGARPPQSDPARRTPRENRDPAPREPQRNAEETASVEICADTGARATVFCPERVTRKFRRGGEPRGRCTLHGR